MVTVADATPVIRRVLVKFEGTGIDPEDVEIGFNREYVKIVLKGSADEASALVWDLLMNEFRNAGWGYHAHFDNGYGTKRTDMWFTHPSTLTRF